MSEPLDAQGIADREAAEWHVRLGERPLTAATLAEFRQWREEPAHAIAYRKLEALWRATGGLALDPDLQEITRQTLRDSQGAHNQRRRSVLLPASAAVVTALVAAVLLGVWPRDRVVYATEVGEQRLVRLEDGSQVRLDTGTRLRVRYADDERRILLDQGQALFMVAHDTGRPFRVEAGSTEVTALGTTFDVRREAAGARVTLVTGSVAVSGGEARQPRRWRLAPGQQVTTSRADAQPRAVDPDLATSWTQGRLVFRNTPLNEAVAEVNRYLPEKITLAGGPADRVAVNGVFTAGDRDAFVAAASDLFGLVAKPQADGGVTLTAPSPGG